MGAVAELLCGAAGGATEDQHRAAQQQGEGEMLRLFDALLADPAARAALQAPRGARRVESRGAAWEGMDADDGEQHQLDFGLDELTSLGGVEDLQARPPVVLSAMFTGELCP